MPELAHRIVELVAADHRRLDRLLARAEEDRGSFERFHAGLLRHISMEERILLPAAQLRNGGDPVAHADELRRDHNRIAVLLAAAPSPRALGELRELLRAHNRVEDTVYLSCMALLGDDEPLVYAALRAQPAVGAERRHAPRERPTLSRRFR